MKLNGRVVFILLGLSFVFVNPVAATLIDVLPGTPTSINGVRVESYLSMGGDEWVTDITDENWTQHDIIGAGNNSLNFYFADLTDYIHLDVYTLGDALVTAGGVFSFAVYDIGGLLVDSQLLVARFGQSYGVEFTSLSPLASRLEVRFHDPDAGGFIQSLSYNSVETPEPSTMAMFMVAGMLLVGQYFRRIGD